MIDAFEGMDTIALRELVESLQSQLTAAHKERDELSAQCASLRNSVNIALAQLRESFSGAGLKRYMNAQFPATEGHTPFTAFCSDVDAAFKTLFDCQLSTTVDTALLERLKEAERNRAATYGGGFMKCEICGKGPLDPEMVGLTRVNEKGVKGIWRCKAHLTFDQEATIEPEVREITEIIEADNRGKCNGY